MFKLSSRVQTQAFARLEIVANQTRAELEQGHARLDSSIVYARQAHEPSSNTHDNSQAKLKQGHARLGSARLHP